MTLYWLLFLIPVVNLYFGKRAGRETPPIVWHLYFWLLVIVIGLRYQVGGDWINYLDGLEVAREMGWEELFDFKKEAGFTLLSWASLSLDLGIYGVNIVCAAIFALGLTRLAKEQPFPWLTIAAATPYLVIVVAMGYTRQAVAIGLLMYGFRFLVDNRVVPYLLVVLVAGLFHKTAMIFLGFALFRPNSGWFTKLIGAGLVGGLVYGSLLVEQAEYLMKVYVEQTMESGGGQIRVAMNLPAALLVFGFWKKWGRLYRDRWLWAIFAVLSIASVFLVAQASTAVDRMALYFIPLQLVVYARLPQLLEGKVATMATVTLLVVYFTVIQFVWLVFATHAPLWVPYGFFPLEWAFGDI